MLGFEIKYLPLFLMVYSPLAALFKFIQLNIQVVYSSASKSLVLKYYVELVNF
uniref:Uncharacterized protein n=1 Tax=Solanum lycopersicum TaxID=4081 RepID=A0A3Q7HKR5_SOLLC